MRLLRPLTAAAADASYPETLGTAGADWAELKIFIIMIFSIGIFAIMMRWPTVAYRSGCSQRVLWISTAATALPLLQATSRQCSEFSGSSL